MRMRTLDETDVISAKDKELLLALKSIVQRSLPTATVLLYGSVARGTQDSESDYDVLILTDARLSRDVRDMIERQVYDLELDREVVLSTIYHTRDEWDTPIVRGSPFYREFSRDAIRL